MKKMKMKMKNLLDEIKAKRRELGLSVFEEILLIKYESFTGPLYNIDNINIYIEKVYLGWNDGEWIIRITGKGVNNIDKNFNLAKFRFPTHNIDKVIDEAKTLYSLILFNAKKAHERN